jgi:hypothetical protein
MRRGGATRRFSDTAWVTVKALMKLKPFLPTPEKLSQETIATLAAIIISAWLISRIPALKQLVEESKT